MIPDVSRETWVPAVGCYFDSNSESVASESIRLPQPELPEGQASREFAFEFNHPVAQSATPPHLRRGAVLIVCLVIRARWRFVCLGGYPVLERTYRLIGGLHRGWKLPSRFRRGGAPSDGVVSGNCRVVAA